MKITITVTPNIEAMMKRLADDFRGGMRAGMINLVETLEAHAVPHMPVKTSNLVNSSTTTVSEDGTKGELRVTAPYAEFIHEGTGIFGPNKREIVIRAKNKKALHWPGARHPVKKVVQKGIKPNPFYDKALKEVDAQKAYEDGMMDYIKAKGW